MAVKKVEPKFECKGFCCGKWAHGSNGGGGAIYGIGIFGAAFYFFPQAVGLGGYLMAAVKSLIWPATLVYHAFKLLNL